MKSPSSAQIIIEKTMECSDASSEPRSDDENPPPPLNYYHHHHPVEPSSSGFLRKPRIMKTDSRRLFAVMLANVFNSTDTELLNDFVHAYFHHDTFSFAQLSQNSSCDSTDRVTDIAHYTQRYYFELDLKSFLSYVQMRMCDTPDITFRLGKMLYKLRANNSGIVYFQCCMIGLRLKDLIKRQSNIFHQILIENSIPVKVMNAPTSNHPVENTSAVDPSAITEPIVKKRRRRSKKQQEEANEYEQIREIFIDPFGEELTNPCDNVITMNTQAQIYNTDNIDSKHQSYVHLYAIQGIMAVHFDGESRIIKINFNVVDFANINSSS